MKSELSYVAQLPRHLIPKPMNVRIFELFYTNFEDSCLIMTVVMKMLQFKNNKRHKVRAVSLILSLNTAAFSHKNSAFARKSYDMHRARMR
jgi:hypothetical protein